METSYGNDADLMVISPNGDPNPEQVIFIIDELENEGIANHIVIACKKTCLLEWTFEKRKSVKTWFEIRWSCFLCGYNVKKYSKICHHFESSHNLTSFEDFCFQCFDCTYAVQCYASFLNHIRFKHYPELITRCDACGVNLNFFNKLASHREKHNVEGALKPHVYICELCGHAFPTQEEKNLHCSNHVYKCETCFCEFKEPRHLEHHRYLHSDYLIPCVVCNYMFSTTYELEEHMKSHSQNLLEDFNFLVNDRVTNNFTRKNQELSTLEPAVISDHFNSDTARTQNQSSNTPFSSPLTVFSNHFKRKPYQSTSSERMPNVKMSPASTM